MKIILEASKLKGSVQIPSSKSHTIRAVAVASLADGISEIENPLHASDTIAALNAYTLFGAKIKKEKTWQVTGTSGNPKTPDNVVDVINSGTTLYIAMATAGLIDGITVFTGDSQIRNRPADALIDAINDLGAKAISTRGNGKAPIIIEGQLKGGKISLDGSKTSQYLTALLLNCPLGNKDTEIEVKNLVEIPYIQMTLDWLKSQKIKCENDNFRNFFVKGGQKYNSFRKTIPGDFSSATFFFCASAVTKSEITLLNMDFNDSQGDKEVLNILKEMGCNVKIEKNSITIKGGDLKGGEFDLNSMPDALPGLAVTACFAEGTTRLVNVAQARLKETDRISVMKNCLTEMGADVQERRDGLIIKQSALHGAKVSGHNDHRIVMALAVAGLASSGKTEIDTAEAVEVTFPNFAELMRDLGAKMKIV